MPSLVAIDIETTGLDAQRDQIIELGAVRFNGARIEDEWSTLINPGRHIPEHITNLTGISDEMVRQAPAIMDVVEEFAAFVGDLPVLGHNVRFDLGFLQRYRVLADNPVVDTYELASVLLPTASRYNLAALGQLLGILLPADHRALDDARVTHRVFHALYESAKALPLDLLAEITQLGEGLDWDGNWLFQQLMRLRYKEAAAAPRRVRRRHALGPLFESDARFSPPQPVGNPSPLDPEEAAAHLDFGGTFARHFGYYEHRPEQIEMTRAVSAALSESRHLLVEAGTGVGKSFAYLVPAALFAVRNNTRVVVSTNTINLQDQLISKDIPDLRAALNLDVRAAVLKGRSNYLCPRRVEIMRQQGPRDADEMRVLSKVLVWQSLEGAGGDRNEINLNRPAEKDIWGRLSAEDDACTSENCIGRMDGACPFHQARQAAQLAHILIVNHALLLTDVATGSRVLPEYQYLIVDEAHHMEAATTGALSFRLGAADLERLLREIGGTSSGPLGYALSSLQGVLRPADAARLSQMAHRVSEMSFRITSQMQDFFFGLSEFVALMREGQQPSQYAYQVRILPATRTMPGWDSVEIGWDATGETLRLLKNNLGEIHKALTDLLAEGAGDLEDAIGSLSSIYRRLSEAEENLSGMIHNPSPAVVYWVEVQPNSNRLTLNAAPLRVGPLIEKYLWHEKQAVILTSATLTTRGEFNYIRQTLDADEADELALGSPFDYENSTLLFFPRDVPEPNAPNFQQTLDRALVALCRATGGRTLVLFTSYAQLKRTAGAISAPLRNHNIVVFEQGEGASPNALLDSFKSSDKAVLLGTRSFWEGVDIPGAALSVVVIVKLPFDVPSDPLIAARSETFEDPFNEYQLPEAILRFRQGFGRLIRSASDRGVVVIMDRRVMSKTYGRNFIESLPNCTQKVAALAELPAAAAGWLDS